MHYNYALKGLRNLHPFSTESIRRLFSLDNDARAAYGTSFS